MEIINTTGMAEIYGKPTADAFRTFRRRNPEQVPPPDIGERQWIKENVIEFLRGQSWKKPKNSRNAGRKRTSKTPELRIS